MAGISERKQANQQTNTPNPTHNFWLIMQLQKRGVCSKKSHLQPQVFRRSLA